MIKRNGMSIIILTAAILGAAAFSGCSDKPEAKKRGLPLDSENSYRAVCQTLLAETIGKIGGAPPENESKKITTECMKTAEGHKGGKTTTLQDEKAYAQRILSVCRAKAGTGQPWIDCYKQEVAATGEAH